MAESTNFLGDLKKSFFTITITVLLGFPAITILVPELFALIAKSNSDSEHIQLYFKIFTFLYFTLPLFTLIIFLIFYIKEGQVHKLQKELIIFLGMICIFFVMVVSPSLTTSLAGMIVMIILLIAGLLYYSTIIYKEILTEASNDRWSNKHTFSIWSLYIVIEICIAVCITLFPGIESSYLFLFISMSLFILPLALMYYTSKKMPVSQTAKRIFIMLTLCLFLLMKFISFTGQPYSFDNANKTYKAYFEPTIIINNKLKKDIEEVNFRLKDIEQAEQTAYLKKTIGLNKNSYKYPFDKMELLKDSVSADLQITTDTLKKEDYKRYKIYLEHEFNRLKQHAQQRLLKLSEFTQKRGVVIFLSTMFILLAFFLIVFFTRSENLLKKQIKDTDKVEEIDKIEASKQITARQKQNAELQNIVHLFTGIFVLVLVLFIPFLKVISEKDMVAENPWGLFKVENWNLNPIKPQDPKEKAPLDNKINPKENTKDSCCCCGSTQAIDALKPEINFLVEVQVAIDSLKQVLRRESLRITVETNTPQQNELLLKLANINVSLQSIGNRIKNANISVLSTDTLKQEQIVSLKDITGQLKKIDSSIIKSNSKAEIGKISVSIDALAKETEKLAKSLQEFDINKKIPQPSDSVKKK